MFKMSQIATIHWVARVYSFWRQTTRGKSNQDSNSHLEMYFKSNILKYFKEILEKFCSFKCEISLIECLSEIFFWGSGTSLLVLFF